MSTPRMLRRPRHAWPTVCAVTAVLLWACAIEAANAAPPAADAEPPLVVGRVQRPSVLSDIGERVVREACRRAGIDVVIKELPLQRSIEMANDGEIDADLMRIADATQRYPNLVAVSTPINRVDIAVYASNSDITKRTRAEIAAMRLVQVRGTLAVAKHTRGMNMTDAPFGAPMVEMVQQGRVDASVQVYVDAETAMSAGILPRLTRWPYLWASEPLYMLVHRKRASVVPRLSAALLLMEREGVIERMYRQALSEAGLAPLQIEGAPVQRPSK